MKSESPSQGATKSELPETFTIKISGLPQSSLTPAEVRSFLLASIEASQVAAVRIQGYQAFVEVYGYNPAWKCVNLMNGKPFKNRRVVLSFTSSENSEDVAETRTRLDDDGHENLYPYYPPPVGYPDDPVLYPVNYYQNMMYMNTQPPVFYRPSSSSAALVNYDPYSNSPALRKKSNSSSTSSASTGLASSRKNSNNTSISSIPNPIYSPNMSPSLAQPNIYGKYPPSSSQPVAPYGLFLPNFPYARTHLILSGPPSLSPSALPSHTVYNEPKSKSRPKSKNHSSSSNPAFSGSFSSSANLPSLPPPAFPPVYDPYFMKQNYPGYSPFLPPPPGPFVPDGMASPASEPAHPPLPWYPPVNHTQMYPPLPHSLNNRQRTPSDGNLGAYNKYNVIFDINGSSSSGNEDPSDLMDYFESINTRRLFFGNLPYKTTLDDLKQALLENGLQSFEIEIPFESFSKGYALVTFENEKAAEKAISIFNNTKFQGRRLTVRYDRFPSLANKNKLNTETFAYYNGFTSGSLKNGKNENDLNYKPSVTADTKPVVGQE